MRLRWGWAPVRVAANDAATDDVERVGARLVVYMYKPAAKMTARTRIAIAIKISRNSLISRSVLASSSTIAQCGQC